MNLAVPQDTRCELKGVIRETYYSNLLHWLRTHPEGFSEAYPRRIINSVYFDTYNLTAYEENLLGSSSRAKVRYRWYGNSRTPDAGKLEIKCKKNSFGWKQNYKIPSAPYHPGATWHTVTNLLLRYLSLEGRFWIYEFPWPVIIIRYHRDYFISKDGQIRVTIDSQQKGFDQRYRPYPNIDRPSNQPETMVMEIKCGKERKKTLSQMMDHIPVRLTRYSKYMIGMKSIQGY